MNRLLSVAGTLAMLALAGGAVAQTGDDSGTRMRLAMMDTSPAAFRKLDTNNDGRISALEAAENPRVAAAFTQGDKDKDGYLSLEEFEALSSSAKAPPDTAASSPSGDHASAPSGDTPATGPNEPGQDTSATGPNEATPAAPAASQRSVAKPR